MAQNFTQIEQAFDTQLLTVTGVTTSNFFKENLTSNFAMMPDITTKLALRSTLVANESVVATLGPSGYIKVWGRYVVDLFAQTGQGYAAAKALGDLVLAAFPPNSVLTLTDGDMITVEIATASPNLPNGAKPMGKLYMYQVYVKWFGYVSNT